MKTQNDKSEHTNIKRMECVRIIAYCSCSLSEIRRMNNGNCGSNTRTTASDDTHYTPYENYITFGKLTYDFGKWWQQRIVSHQRKICKCSGDTMYSVAADACIKNGVANR